MRHNLLETLSKISRDINGALTIDHLFQIALNHSLDFVDTSDGFIVLSNRVTNQLQFKAGMVKGQWLTSYPERKSNLLQFNINKVIHTGCLINCSDCKEDPNWIEGDPHSFLCIPIANDARILGAITVESHEVGAFKSEAEQFLTMIGEHVALAIESHMLRSLSTELSMLPVEKILPRIAEIACFLFAARSSAVLLTDHRVDETIRGARFPLSNTATPLMPRSNKLTYRITSTCKPLIIQDAQQNPDVRPTTKERGIQSILGVPLLTSQSQETGNEIRAIGALFIDLIENRTFSEREQMILQSLANLAAIAIEKARHTQALHSLNQNYLEITRDQLDIPSLAGKLLSQAATLVNAKGGRLCLLDETGTEVKWAVMTNFPEKPVRIKMEATVGVFGHVLRTQKPFAVPNYQNWPNRRKDFDKYGFTAVAGVPIIYQNHLWGVILVHDTVEGRIFAQEDLDLLENLGNLAAVAFENARRYDDLERMIESAATTVIAIDDQGRITQFNQQAEEMLQYKREEVLGKSIEDIYYHQPDPRRIKRLMLETPDGKIKEYTTYLRNKQGQKVPIKLSASLLFDYEGKRSGSVGFFYDQRRNHARATMASLLDKKDIFQGIVDQAWEMTGAPHSAHLALNIENKLQVTVARPLELLTQKQRMPIDLKNDDRIGISGRAFNTGESQLVSDVTLDPEYIPFDRNIHSELSVPIKTQQEVIGVIDVQHPQKNAFSETDQRNLETLAQFAAIAIQNSQLYDESQIDKQRFKIITEIIREAAQNRDIKDLLRSTCRRLEAVFGEKEAIVSIRLYDKSTNVLRFEPEWHEFFHHRIDHKLSRTRTIQSLDEGICGLAARTRRSQNVGDVDKNTNYLCLIVSTKSEICVPIQLDETQELIGVLDLQSPFLNAFTRNDLEYLELLAGHLAVDIDKAQLIERERKVSEAQKALSKVNEIVIRLSELDETLNQITQHVYQLAQDRKKQVHSVILRLVRGSKRILAAAQPSDLLSKLQKDLPEVEIREGVGGRIGISGRAILTGESQNVGDVSLDPDYLLLNGTTRSELAIPILIDGKVIAAMDIECAEKDAFDEDDKLVFEALAAQAGIAIHAAYQYATLERRNRHQQAIYKASRIISRGIVLNLRELLYRILEQAVELIQPAGGKKVSIGVILLYDEDKNELRRECIYPLEASNTLKNGLGATRLIRRASGHYIGINGRAVLEGKTQRVNDVSQDSDYFGLSETTCSELDVLLLDEDSKVLGTLGLESEVLNAFDEEDEQVLQSLADLAVIAIRNSQQYQILQDTKDKLAARTAIAWLGAARGIWDHKTAGHIAAIEQYVKLLEGDIKPGWSDEKIKERLSRIKLVIEKTREQKITTPLSPDQGRELVDVDNFIRQWIEKVYWDADLLSEMPYQLKLNSSEARIRVNLGWFKLAIDNIINNALRAMKIVSIKRLMVKTQRLNNMVEIIITDTGPGIPRDIQFIYGRSMIKKEQGAQGEGIGLMLSNMIIQTYDGEMGILETNSLGTSIFVRLPCE